MAEAEEANAGLEKVTDYHAEKELNENDTANALSSLADNSSPTLIPARPTDQTQAGVVESQGTMGVPVVVHPEVSMACDAGSVSPPTGASKDGSSWDGKIPPPKDGVREIASRPTTAAGSSGSRGGGRFVGLLAVAFASAIKLGNVESSMLVELPSGFRCIWNNLPHLVQFAAILLMVVLMYGVNRVFDRADDAMSARLSSATATFLHERRQHYPPRVVYTATREEQPTAYAIQRSSMREGTTLRVLVREEAPRPSLPGFSRPPREPELRRLRQQEYAWYNTGRSPTCVCPWASHHRVIALL